MRALVAFWQRGFEGCSISDLTEATGLPRQSLYNTFGGKRELFLRVLARYRQRVDEDLAPLRAPEATLGELRCYMLAALGVQSELGGGACLLVVTAFGPASTDPEVQAAIDAGAASVRRAFSRLLQRLRDDEVLPYDADPKAGGDFLYAMLNGLSALQRTGAGSRRVRTALDAALRSL